MKHIIKILLFLGLFFGFAQATTYKTVCKTVPYTDTCYSCGYHTSYRWVPGTCRYIRSGYWTYKCCYRTTYTTRRYCYRQRVCTKNRCGRCYCRYITRCSYRRVPIRRRVCSRRWVPTTRRVCSSGHYERYTYRSCNSYPCTKYKRVCYQVPVEDRTSPFIAKRTANNQTTAKVGDILTYQLTFGNKSDAQATLQNLTVRDNLPSGLELINVVDKPYNFNCSTSSHALTCTGYNLNYSPGTTRTILYRAKVTQSGTQTNTARVENYNGTDVYTGDNTSSFTVGANQPQQVTQLLADYHFDECDWNKDTIKDSTGNTIAHRVGSPINTTTEQKVLCRSAKFYGAYKGSVEINNINVSTQQNAATTVSFWMYWDGRNTATMPFSWRRYTLYLVYDGYFGFNTLNNDLYGVHVPWLKNGWHHITAVFVNGDVYKSQLYIDGIKQNLQKIRYRGITGSAYQRNAYVTNSARVGGLDQNGRDCYVFSGYIDEVMIFKGALSETKIRQIYYNQMGGKNYDGTQRQCKSCTVPQNINLLAEYRFDDCKWTGTNYDVKDSTGHGYNGKAINGATPSDTSKILCRSAAFNRSRQQYIQLNHDFHWSKNDSFSISAWIKPECTSTSSCKELIIGKHNPEYSFMVTHNVVRFIYWSPGGIEVIHVYSDPNKIPITSNNWYHVTFTYDGNSHTPKIYINGVDVTRVKVNRTSYYDFGHSYENTRIGNAYIWQEYRQYEYFQGNIDELKIFEGALSAQKVQEMYNNEKMGRNYNGTSRVCPVCTEEVSPYVEKKASNNKTSANLGEEITYELRVGNKAEAKANITKIKVEDKLPAGLKFVSFVNVPTGFNCTNSNNTITCTAQNITMKPNMFAIIEYKVKAIKEGSQTNNATISNFNGDDMNTQDNTTSYTLNVKLNYKYKIVKVHQDTCPAGYELDTSKNYLNNGDFHILNGSAAPAFTWLSQHTWQTEAYYVGDNLYPQDQSGRKTNASINQNNIVYSDLAAFRFPGNSTYNMSSQNYMYLNGNDKNKAIVAWRSYEVDGLEKNMPYVFVVHASNALSKDGQYKDASDPKLAFWYKYDTSSGWMPFLTDTTRRYVIPKDTTAPSDNNPDLWSLFAFRFTAKSEKVQFQITDYTTDLSKGAYGDDLILSGIGLYRCKPTGKYDPYIKVIKTEPDPADITSGEKVVATLEIGNSNAAEVPLNNFIVTINKQVGTNQKLQLTSIQGPDGATCNIKTETVGSQTITYGECNVSKTFAKGEHTTMKVTFVPVGHDYGTNITIPVKISADDNRDLNLQNNDDKFNVALKENDPYIYKRILEPQGGNNVTVYKGDTIKYALDVGSEGFHAKDVTIDDKIPQGLEFVQFDQVPAPWSCNYDNAAHAIHCTSNDTIESVKRIIYRLKVADNASEGKKTNTARINDLPSDSNLTNNKSSCTVIVSEKKIVLDAKDWFRPADDYHISTKRVNDNNARFFDLSINSLNADNRSEHVPFTGTVCIRIVDETNPSHRLCSHGIWQAVHFNNETQKNVTLCATESTRNARILMKWYKNKTISAAACGVMSADGESKSRDNFAIMPNRFKIEAPNIVKAGNDFNITFKATEIISGQVVRGFSNVQAGQHVVVEVRELNSSAILGTFSPDITNNWSFTDGLKRILTKYSEVGKVEIRIREKAGSEYALVDKNDPRIPGYWEPVEDPNYVPANTAEEGNKLRRYIIPAKKVIEFVPDHFVVTAQTNNAHSNCFTYISDNIANERGTITYTIKAVNKDGAVTKNYSGNLYAKNVATKAVGFIETLAQNPQAFIQSLKAKYNTSTNSVVKEAQAIYETGTTTSSTVHHTNFMHNIFNSMHRMNPLSAMNALFDWSDYIKSLLGWLKNHGYAAVGYHTMQTDIPKGSFVNGVATQTVHLNYCRDACKPRIPFKTHIRTITVTDGSASGTMNNQNIGELIYYYGRVYAPKETDVKGNEGAINLRYEVYDPIGDDPGSVEGSANDQDNKWKLNTLHDNASGTITKLIHSSSGTDLLQTSDTELQKANLDPINGGKQKVNLKYLGNNYPYTAELKLQAPGYLMYNPQNGFNMIKITFNKPGKWSGVGGQGSGSQVEENREASKRTDTGD